MKRIILYSCLLVAILFSCQSEDGDFVYHQKDNIYFGIGTTVGLSVAQVEKDALLPKGIQDPRRTFYSFAIDQKVVDTIYIPVTISGQRAAFPRSFKVSINPDSTSAQVGLHYRMIEGSYTIPADSGSTWLPLVLFNKDTLMETQSFKVGLTLEPNDDFDVTVLANSYASVTFSSRLERPIWWSLWERNGTLGSYTRTKHALYLIALEGIEDKDLVPDFETPANQSMIPYDRFLVGKFQALLLDPVLWIKDHPNYDIDDIKPGVKEFYSVANPVKKYRLVLDPEEGKYYFLDENGAHVSLSL